MGVPSQSGVKPSAHPSLSNQPLYSPFLLDTPVLPHYPSHFLETCQINLGFWETAHLPLFKPTLTLTTHLGQNVGLGEG